MGHSRIGLGARINRWVWTAATLAALAHAADDAVASTAPTGLLPTAGAYATTFSAPRDVVRLASDTSAGAGTPPAAGLASASTRPEMAFAAPLLW